MSEPVVETPAEGGEPQPKPTETVDFWKQKAREQEKRAKENADARKQLDELTESRKSEIEKAQERAQAAEAEAATLPAKVAGALKSHLVTLHDIDAEDAELFLTATDPELLLKQVAKLVGRGSGKKSNHVPREGNNPTGATNNVREFTRELFNSGA
jgi:C4-dicarboxylate-specific signal transduction histidine kinase